MIPLPRHSGRTVLLSALAVFVSACTGADVPSSTTAAGPPIAPTSLPSITTTGPTTTVTTVPPTTLAEPGGLAADIADLIDIAEDVRGLGFLIPPEIVMLNSDAFAARVAPLIDARGDAARDDAIDRFFALIGLDGADTDVTRSDVLGLPASAWYDETSGELLIVETVSALSPLAKSEIVHEVVHALTDEHYRWSETRQTLLGEAAHDRLRSFDGLVEGDATYFQLVYVQQLPQSEQEAIARTFVEASSDIGAAPTWLVRDVAFPFDNGFDFVADLVAGGGIAAVDRAYLEPPTTTEQILHPERYRRGEVGTPADQDDAVIDSYKDLGVASFGELGLRLLFEESMRPGVLTQTTDGWGGDAYQLFVADGGAVAFSYLYLGDAESHTAEVTQAFIDLAERLTGLNDGERTNGGEVYARNGRPWVFLDREGLGLLVIIASDRATGRALADQLKPPA